MSATKATGVSKPESEKAESKPEAEKSPGAPAPDAPPAGGPTKRSANKL